MKEMNATEFKAKCLKLLEQMGSEGIVITKRGTPIAHVLPYKTSELQTFYGCMKNKIKIRDNIFSTGIKWRAQS